MTDLFVPPTLSEIQDTAKRIFPYVQRTPTTRWSGGLIKSCFGASAEVHVKLELMQRTGSFKARGAINNALALTEQERRKGVAAVSAGNHAIAAAYAASCVGTSAKVVMLASANPLRVAAARDYGAEVIIASDGPAGFALVEDIVNVEGRTFIHPFEGRRVTEATATCGLEFIEDAGALDAIIVPIGGGGLCSGIALAAKLARHDCKVYGVEPVGSSVMTKSFSAGSPQRLSHSDTIADSLAPPMTTPYAYAMCRQYVDEIVLVDDEQISAAAALLFREMKLAVEPAAAAATAAAFGPLRSKLENKRIGIIVCGANIDLENYVKIVRGGFHSLDNNILGLV